MENKRVSQPKLRDYQLVAVNMADQATRQGLSPCVVLPCGAGKTLVAAELLRRYAKEGAYSITHTRELIRQNARAFAAYCPEIPYSVYSAGLGSKCLKHQVLFAGIQSLVHANGDLRNPRLTIIDEASRIPFRGEDSQYEQVLTRLGRPLVGLTATPYRLEGGETRLITEGKGAWFDVLIQPTTTAELQVAGWLSPLVGVASRDSVDTAGVHTRMGEFVTSELEEVATEPACVSRVCEAIKLHADERRKILVFAVSVAHSEALCAELTRIGIPSAHVDGEMDYELRDATLERFREGGVRALVNCQVLTMGYDEPAIDCVAMVRPTQSKALFCQAISRGLRKAEGKSECQIIDMGGNWLRHGAIDGLPVSAVVDEPMADRERKGREREEREQREREETKYQFPVHTGPLGLKDGEPYETQVSSIDYRVTVNAKNTSLMQVMVTYHTVDIGRVTIWLLPEHTGGARWHSGQWFARRKLRMPANAEQCVKLARTSAAPKSISVTREGNFWRVLNEHFGDK